jgi:hypothetical protein
VCSVCGRSFTKWCHMCGSPVVEGAMVCHNCKANI